MKKPMIDRTKLRDEIRRMGDEYAYYLLHDLIDVVPDAKLAKIVSKYIRLERLQSDGEPERDLLTQVKAFEKASLERKYYEDFFVDSKNYTTVSNGTRAWIAECCRLLEKLVAAKKDEPARRVEGFEIVFGLLRRMDEGTDEFLFFADEGGSWIVGVDWKNVYPAYFAVLAKVAEPDDYARRVMAAIELDGADGGKEVEMARKVGSREQRAALQRLGEAGIVRAR